MNFLQGFFPYQTQQRIFFLQLAQFLHGQCRVSPFRQNQPVRQCRLQHRFQITPTADGCFIPQSLTGPGFRQPRYCTDGSRFCFLYHFEGGSSVETNLIRFFFPEVLFFRCTFSIVSPDDFSGLQTSAGNLHVCLALSLLVTGNLVDPRTERCRVRRQLHVFCQGVQKLLHSLYFQGRAEADRVSLTVGHRLTDQFVVDSSVFKVLLHHLFAAHGQSVQRFFRWSSCRTFSCKLTEIVLQVLFQCFQQSLTVCSRLVHLVHEKESRNPVKLKQLPQCYGMSLDSVRSIDD